ncbi:MAG: M56 family metallopeptidase, partial [Planctomycetota bacterium]
MSGMIAIAAVESFADNIGWTLLHFTWQASIIGLIAGLALFFVRREAAHVRYAICCLGMTLLALAPVATAGYLVKNTPTPVVSIDYHLEALAPEIDARPTPSFDPSSDLSPPELSDASVTSPPAFVEGQRGWRMRLDATLQPWMHWIVGGWLVGVALLMCRLAGGLWRIRVWAQTASETNDALLDATFARLRKQLGVSPNVRVLESARVAVPMVIGCLRPAVLVPTSLLSGLTTVELESILAHELAHIRRHDYFVNLLQNLLETLLFFHPVIWWLSRQTRIEREHCCDELAIGACGDRPALAVALLKIEESRSVDRRMVAANGGALTGRIRRILQKDTVANDWPTAAATFLTLLVILAVVTISSARATDDLSSEPQTLTAIVDSDDQTDEKDQSDKKDDGDNANVFATRMNEVLRKDSETGIEKRVFAGIRMMAKDGRQVTQDMIYSNVFSYSFISQSIANKLGAEVLGEIDFLDHSPTKTERSGSQSDLVVSQVT